MSLSKLLRNNDVALVTKNDSAAPAKKEYTVKINTGVPSFSLRFKTLYRIAFFDKVFVFN